MKRAGFAVPRRKVTGSNTGSVVAGTAGLTLNPISAPAPSSAAPTASCFTRRIRDAGAGSAFADVDVPLVVSRWNAMS